MRQLKTAFMDSLSAVLPIVTIVLLLSFSLAPLNTGVLVLFLFGAFLLILGMSFFTIGSEISMKPLGEGIGVQLVKFPKIWIPILITFGLGFIATIAEPDLQVLAEQVPSIPNLTLILFVAVGCGIFLAIAIWRSRRKIPLSIMLIIGYALVFVLLLFVPEEFIPTAFDSGGVTTGPITVPFVMALGAGFASLGSDKDSLDNSFGLVALCSIGPILSVLILSICYSPTAETTATVIASVETTKDAFFAFCDLLPMYAEDVGSSFLPIVGIFLVFQLISRRFRRNQFIRVAIGLVYTYIGLVLFMTGVNVGFMPAGHLIGSLLADGPTPYVLIPIGMLMGYFIVSAEPAVIPLKKQVEEVTNGSISQKAIGIALSVGVAVSVGISMLRVVTGISIFPFLIVGYAVSLIITYFVPHMYTGIAFDSGGVASGALSSTFLVPFSIGACETLGGNVMTDAFGMVAMVAMTPLITIQILGLVARIKQQKLRASVHEEFANIPDDMLYYYDFSEEAAK